MTWSVVPIGTAARVVSGATPSTSCPEYWGGSICWATPKDISELNGSKFLDDTPRKLTEAGLRSCSAEVLPPNSVLFSSRAPIGLVAINRVPTATNQGFKSFVPDPSKLDTGYLFHWLRAHRAQIERMGVGATFSEVSKAIVSRIEIPLPPIDEQQRIAAMLDKAEELRAKRRAAIALLDQLPQAIFLEMFGDPFANPMNWPVEPLIRHVDVRRPITYGILKPGDDISDGVPYVRVVDMQDGGIRVDGLKRTTQAISHLYKRSLLQRGDVLLSIRGHVGRLAVVPANLEGANITQDTARLALQEMRPDFLVECLRTSSFQRWMARHTKGAAVKGINLGDVKEAPIPIPPSHLQDRFASALEPIRSARAAQRSALAESDAFFVSLQAQAFSGQLAKPMELSHD